MRYKILTVDDSKTVRIIVKKAFKSFDCDILEASNGVEGLAVAAKEAPDVCLLDITMPVMDGVEMLTKLKSDPLLKSIPVVMLTTSQSDDDVCGSYARHASGYVVKPVGFENFLGAIRAFEEFWMTYVRFPPRL